MNIYISTSITGGRAYADMIQDFFVYVRGYGTIVDEDILALQERLDEAEYMTPEEIALQAFAWLSQADIIIAEVSNPSLGVGYELARGVEHSLPVYAFWYKGAEKGLSPFIAGNTDITIYEYNDLKEAKNKIDEIFNQ